MTIGAWLQPDGRIALADGLRLTLQRTFAEDWQSEGTRPPQSYGRLPFERARDGVAFVMPILCGEHVWIGLERAQHDTITEITMVLQAGGTILTRTCPPEHAIKGVPVGHLYRAFAPGDVLSMMIGSENDVRKTSVQLVACVADKVLDASIRQGLSPLDRRAGFVGVRLP